MPPVPQHQVIYEDFIRMSLKFLMLKHRTNDVQPAAGPVLYLDSSNVLSYPGSGNTWTDLSPSANNFSFVGSPTYDAGDAKSINFDFGTQYAESAFPQRIGPGYATTIEVVFKRTALFSSDIILSHNRSANPHGFIQVIGGSSGMQFIVISTMNPPYAYSVGHPTSISNGSWYHGIVSVNIPNGYSVTMSGNIAVNGSIQSFSQNIQAEAGASNYKLELCRHINYIWGNSYGKFKIGLVRIYDRQLTTAEMAQNFNSCRSRFGL